MKKKKNKGGRPKIKINWDQFEKLCGMQCTLDEIADWFRCSDDTIENAVKKHFKKGFSDIFNQKRVAGRVSLRRKQMQVAMEGNVTMLIWLGKQYLGQKDEMKLIEEGHPKTVNVNMKGTSHRDRISEVVGILAECGVITGSVEKTGAVGNA